MSIRCCGICPSFRTPLITSVNSSNRGTVRYWVDYGAGSVLARVQKAFQLPDLVLASGSEEADGAAHVVGMAHFQLSRDPVADNSGICPVRAAPPFPEEFPLVDSALRLWRRW
jgi:hypothetical protein